MLQKWRCSMLRNSIAPSYYRSHDDIRSGLEEDALRVIAHTPCRVTAHTFSTFLARTLTSIRTNTRHSTCENHVTAHTLAGNENIQSPFRYRVNPKTASLPNQFSLIKDTTCAASRSARNSNQRPDAASGQQIIRFECKNIETFTFKCKNIETFTFEGKAIAINTTEFFALTSPRRRAHNVIRYTMNCYHKASNLFRSSRTRSVGSRVLPCPHNLATPNCIVGDTC